jgi:hypothetical protein
VTEHEPPASVQVVADRVPPVGVALQVTAPLGVVGVPRSVSLTVAVQVAEVPMRSGSGEQATLTALVRRLTLRPRVPELGR